MKSSNRFFFLLLTTLMLVTGNPVFSQNQMGNNHYAISASLAGWEPAENWLQLFRETFGTQAGLQWISELSLEGAFFTSRNSEGFIIVLPDYMNLEAKLKAKMEYGFNEGKITLLLPLEGARACRDNEYTAKFIGTLGGVPATLDMTVIEQNGKYIAVFGFSPGQELNSSFSQYFQKVAPKLVKSPEWAAR